ncbi:hypothetical protein BH10PSE16_BH10PSE16_19540 [soil metagenome]
MFEPGASLLRPWLAFSCDCFQNVLLLTVKMPGSGPESGAAGMPSSAQKTGDCAADTL